ncbi:flagellar hook-length control protein FliK [Allohahella sp. A8]|uniref:flagellar hook-length control protein FliK n=1 Tax=Allohahella sp. A8 TaxID=3141461 RepID=UPI003A806BDC
MSIDNNIGSPPGGGYTSSRRNAGATGDAGRSTDAAKSSAETGGLRESKSVSASSTIDDVQRLPDGTRLEARVVSVTAADLQLQQSMQLRNQQAALLALRLQLTSQPLPGTAPREGAVLTTTITATQLAAALSDHSRSAGRTPTTAASDTSGLQGLKQAVSAQPFLQLRISGGRLELLSATALPTSADSRAAVTLQSQQQSLAKWMPLQADSRASLRAILDLAGTTASPASGAKSATAAEPVATALHAKLDKALGMLAPPPVSAVRTEGFLQKHMQTAGVFMENRLAATLSAASASPQESKPASTSASPANPFRNLASALKQAFAGETGKTVTNTTDARMQTDALLTNARNSVASRLPTTPSSSSPTAAGALPSLPPSDLKSAVIEALGLVLKLQAGNVAGADSRESQATAAGGPAAPQTAAQLIRVLRAEILKTLETPTRLASLSPDAQEQAAASMISRAARNISKDDSDRDTGEILKHLARLLARVQTNQLTSIQGSQQAEAELPGSQTLVLDLPFLHHQAEMVTVLMERYPGPGRQGDGPEEARYGYRIVLDFNFDKSERITSLKTHVRYTEGTVSAAFWTGSEKEAGIIATHLPQLRQELIRWGLTVGELSLQVGDAPPAREGVRKQILNERI